MTSPTTRSDSEARAIAEGLTEAQRRYLVALGPNEINPLAPAWIREVEGEFRHYRFRKPIGGRSLDSAGALIRKGIVVDRPEPCECGWHYVNLTPLGREVKAILEEARRG